MRIAVALVLTAMCVSPVAAQTRRPLPATASAATSISFRPFVVVSGQHFTASQTFDAVFATPPLEPFWGGGLEVAWRSGLFVDVSASRFHKDGQRVFVSNGQAFPLGTRLTATITPFEVMGGYHFPMTRRAGPRSTTRVRSRVTPYVAGGFSRVAYSEVSQFTDAAENVDTPGFGVAVVGGAEVRVHKWISISGDVEYTRVTGILGTGGASKEFGETDIGGTSVRVRVLVGR